MIISKKLVAHRFKMSHSLYDKSAQAQEKIAAQLAHLLYCYQTQFESLLEIGCGTGGLTKQLAYQIKATHWVMNDLCDVKSFIQPYVPEAIFYQGDFEQIDFNMSFDLISTASTVQWFIDQQAFLQKVVGLLNTNGLFACSTFSPENLTEIRTLTGIGLHYPSLSQWQQWLAPDFEILHLTEQSIQLLFDSPKTALQHLRHTGVTATNQQIWTKNRLNQLYQDYQQQFSVGQQVSLTYAPIFILARKK